MSDESELPGQRIKAWLIGCEAPGVADDVAALSALFKGEVHPDHRGAVEVVRSGAGTVTEKQVYGALKAVRDYDGRRFVWFGGHGDEREVGVRSVMYLQTDGPGGGHLRAEDLW